MTDENKSRYCVLLCTTPTREVAQALADSLIPQKLAACVNIVENISSIYRWKGEVCQDTECLMIIKSKCSLFKKIEHTIKTLHPYEVPEIISLPLLQGHDPYLQWIDENTDHPL